MNVASLELCKELYELSGWSSQITHNEPTPSSSLVDQVPICPAYDLGYLLRKLPVGSAIDKASDGFGARRPPVYGSPENVMQPGYKAQQTRFPANTPEDATAKLAIELWKQGMLK